MSAHSRSLSAGLSHLKEELIQARKTADDFCEHWIVVAYSDKALAELEIVFNSLKLAQGAVEDIIEKFRDHFESIDMPEFGVKVDRLPELLEEEEENSESADELDGEGDEDGDCSRFKSPLTDGPDKRRPAEGPVFSTPLPIVEQRQTRPSRRALFPILPDDRGNYEIEAEDEEEPYQDQNIHYSLPQSRKRPRLPDTDGKIPSPSIKSGFFKVEPLEGETGEDVKNTDNHLIRPSPRASRKPKLYICEYDGCKQSYIQRSHLVAHKRSHTGGKPYPCTWEACSWKFDKKDSLARHYRTHTGDKPFTCKHCQSSFKRSDHLTKHVKRLHETPLQQQTLKVPQQLHKIPNVIPEVENPH